MATAAPPVATASLLLHAQPRDRGRQLAACRRKFSPIFKRQVTRHLKRPHHCKQRRHESIGVRPLREFLGVVIAGKANRGIFVTSGVFSEVATAFADAAGQLELIDGHGLLAMVQAVQRTEKPETTCPKCGSAMIRKSGKRGPFLSCGRYPACRGSRDLPNAA